MLNSSPEASLPGVSLTNGPIVRATSRWWLVSTRTTVAPKSAITRVVAGPAIAHVRSSTLTPVERRPHGAAVRCRRATAAARGRPRSTSSVCSPRRGARPRRIGATTDERTHGPGRGDRRGRQQLVVDVVEVLAAPRTAALSTHVVAAWRPGRSATMRSHAASSSSAFVLVAQNSPTSRFSRSYSSIGSRPS